MSVSSQWRIERPGEACSRCGEGFAENQVLYSALSERDGGFVRHDFCPACWEKADRNGCFCFWRRRHVQGEAKRAVETGPMLEFFERLEGADSEQKRVFRYLLGLYLVRRRALKLVGRVRSAEGEALVLERRQSGTRTQVAAPSLTQEQMDAAAERLRDLLNADL